MVGDGFDNLRGRCQGPSPVGESDRRGRALPDRAQKAGQLSSQRLLLLDFGLIRCDAGKCAGSHAGGVEGVKVDGVPAGIIDGQHQHVLARIVERDVLMRLEEAQLSNAFRADAAGGEVGDAARLKFQRTLAMSVFLERIGRPTARISFTGELTNDSTTSRSWIMRSRMTSTSSERGVNTLRRWTSKNMGCFSKRNSRANGGIEALEMPGLGNAAVLTCKLDELIGFGYGRGQRLLDQDIDAVFHQLPSDRQVMNRGYSDRGRLNAGGDQLVRGLKCASAELFRDRLATSAVSVDNSNELDILRCVCVKIAVDARMIAAERATSDDTDAQRAVFAGHALIFADSAIEKQRAVRGVRATRRFRVAQRSWSRHAPSMKMYCGEKPSLRKPSRRTSAADASVGRLNVGFEAMEPELVEAAVEDQRERLGHQPSVFASCESIKAQVRALEDAHDGLTDVDHADRSVVGRQANEVRNCAPVLDALQVGKVLLVSAWREDPGMMQLLALDYCCDELVLALGVWSGKEDSIALRGSVHRYF